MTDELLSGRYALEARLGRGGMGDVWRAHDRQLDAKVAVKLLELDATGESREKQIERFQEEAKAAAQIRSPHVVQVLDHGVDGERRYIVMEMLEGESLRDKLEREKRLSAADTFRVIQHASRALVRAHALGIVHRDLKPENLFIVHNDDEDVIKVLDFGIAKRAGMRRTSGRGMMVGTPSYMSPEQGMASADIDARTDIWALGIIAFECLCGKVPFTGRGPAEIIINVASKPAPIPSEVAPVPKSFDAWFAKACAKKPEDRFDTVADQAAQLRTALGIDAPAPRDTGEHPIVIRTGSAFAPTVPIPIPQVTAEPVETVRTPPRRRWPPPASIAMAVAVAIAIVGAIAYVKLRPAPKVGFVDRVPTTGKPEAIAEYRAALQSLHDASIASGTAHLEKAIGLDPSIAQANLRSAMWESIGNDARRRRFAAAFDLRSTLDEHDRALLEIVEASVKNNDAVEATKRARAAAARFADDPEIWWALATYAQESHDAKEAIEAADRALALDPTFALALWTKANVLEDEGRVEELRRTLDECVRISPGAGSCIRFRADQLALAGDCNAFEADARHLIATEPDGPRPYEYLMRALAARGDLAGADEARNQFGARMPDVVRSRRDRYWKGRLALLRGDFEEANRLADEQERETSATASTELHNDAWDIWLETAAELGDAKRSLDLASTFSSKRTAWSDHANSGERRHDVTIVANAILLREGKIDMAEYVRRRADWHAATNAGSAGPDIWKAEYGRPSDDIDLAKQALDAANAAVTSSRITWATLGRAHLLGGNAARAVELLEPATRSCLVLDDPVEHTRAHLWLGQALEKTGDTRGACSAYAKLLQRWSHGTTSDTARARSKAIGCK